MLANNVKSEAKNPALIKSSKNNLVDDNQEIKKPFLELLEKSKTKNSLSNFNQEVKKGETPMDNDALMKANVFDSKDQMNLKFKNKEKEILTSKLEELNNILKNKRKPLNALLQDKLKSPIFKENLLNRENISDKDLLNISFIKGMNVVGTNNLFDSLMGEAKKTLEKKLSEALKRTDANGNEVKLNLPTTLKGLLMVAQKEGINIKKMSINDLNNTSTKQSIITNIKNNLSSVENLENLKRKKLKNEYEELNLKLKNLDKQSLAPDIKNNISTSDNISLKDILKSTPNENLREKVNNKKLNLEEKISNEKLLGLNDKKKMR